METNQKKGEKMENKNNAKNMTNNSEFEQKNDRKTASILEDIKINVKIVLAALWAGHFMLWTFGDMAALLQQLYNPVENSLLLLVAVPLAMTQALMIIFNLVGKPKYVRWANIGVVSAFALFNLGYLAESSAGWQSLLGVAYLLFNVLIIMYAWKWPKVEA